MSNLDYKIEQEQRLEPADTTRIPQDRQPVVEQTDQRCFSIFLQIGLDDPDYLSQVIGLLMASVDTDQIICVSPCRQHLIDAYAQAMKVKYGVIVSLLLPDTRESLIAIKAWAVKAANQMGLQDVQVVVQEAYTVNAPAENSVAFSSWF